MIFPDNEFDKIKGILFDVDGTFYHQFPLRAIMLCLFGISNLHKPKELFRKAIIISKYRKAQEYLRNSPIPSTHCAASQLNLAVAQTGESLNYVAETTIEWLEKRPLFFIPICRRRKLNRNLKELTNRGYKLGIFSDYPPQQKLQALGIEKYFTIVLSSFDDEITNFKPKTNGFSVAAKRMGLKTSEIIYVGDRPEIDGFGAKKAGMKAIIIKNKIKFYKHCCYKTIISFDELVNDLRQSRRLVL